jgi:hypothetical protein
MSNKRKLLFVVAEFWQGGAQRHAFEIYKAVNKEIFNITILSLRDLESSTDWKDFYYERYKNQETPVYFLQSGKSKTELHYS